MSEMWRYLLVKILRRKKIIEEHKMHPQSLLSLYPIPFPKLGDFIKIRDKIKIDRIQDVDYLDLSRKVSGWTKVWLWRSLLKIFAEGSFGLFVGKEEKQTSHMRLGLRSREQKRKLAWCCKNV